MHSERTAAFESINDENNNAYHTSDGMLNTYKKNEPQSDFFWQTIDLQRLPGTTVLRGSAVKPNIMAAVKVCSFYEITLTFFASVYRKSRIIRYKSVFDYCLSFVFVCAVYTVSKANHFLIKEKPRFICCQTVFV